MDMSWHMHYHGAHAAVRCSQWCLSGPVAGYGVSDVFVPPEAPARTRFNLTFLISFSSQTTGGGLSRLAVDVLCHAVDYSCARAVVWLVVCAVGA